MFSYYSDIGTLPLVLLLFVLGATFGSFLHVVGVRLPKGKTFTNDRSGCPSCGHTLRWYELIPVISYIVQRGRCRTCATHIPARYLAAELATGALFALAGFRYGLTPDLALALVFITMVVILFVTDVLYMLIPDKVLLTYAPVLFVLTLWTGRVTWLQALSGLVFGLALLALIIVLSRGGMGAGDMKLFGVLGLVLGPVGVVLTLAVASIVGGVYTLWFVARGRAGRKEPVPFGPAILLAALFMLFYGDAFVAWYVGFWS